MFKRKCFILATLLICFFNCLCFAYIDPSVNVDIQGDSDNLQNGFLEWNAVTSSTKNLSTFFDSSFTVQETNAYADRHKSGNDATGVYADLIEDMVYASNSGTNNWKLTFTNLSSGQYLLTSWHNEPRVYDFGTIDVNITDADRTDENIVSEFDQSTASSSDNAASQNILFRCDGNNVDISFLSATAGTSGGYPILNGFRLVSTQDEAKVDIQANNDDLQEGWHCFLPEVNNSIQLSALFDTDFTVSISDISAIANRAGRDCTGNLANMIEEMAYAAAADSNTIELTISNLESGDYTITTWHNDARSISLGWIDVNITDATRTDLNIEPGLKQSESANSNYAVRVVTDFTSDGNDVVLKFIGVIADDHSVPTPCLNGFVISAAEPMKASYPEPFDQHHYADPDVNLTWTPGTFASSTGGHGVYFGTDYSTVENATTASAEYKGNQDSNSYNPGSLTKGNTYYWRIDDVNMNANITWPGDVLTFTVRDYNIAGDVNYANDFYVSTTGSNNNNGSISSPFATPARAAEAVRTAIANGYLTGDINVYLRGGTYYQDTTILMNEQYSGTDSYSITYQAYPGEHPIISGGENITGWSQDPCDANLYSVTLSDVNTGDRWFRQLWKDDARCQRSRWPNPSGDPDDYPTILAVANGDTTLTLDTAVEGSDLNAYETEISVRTYWADTKALILNVNGYDVNTVTCPGYPTSKAMGPAPDTEYSYYKTVYFENNPDYIDQDTEWSLHPSTGLLTYKAPSGEEPNNCTFVAPKLERLLTIEGTDKDHIIKNVIFKGLTFRHTKSDLPSFGYAPALNGMYRDPGNTDKRYFLMPGIYLAYADSCKFDRCNIEHFGETGVALGAHCVNNEIIDCDISDIGAIGVVCGWKADADDGKIDISSYDNWEDPCDYPKDNKVSNCYIHDISWNWEGQSGIFIGYSHDTEISNNIVKDLPFCGISSGFGQNTTENPNQKGTQILENHIYDLCNIFDDGGGIYTNGDHDGGDIIGNYIHDVGPQWRPSKAWLNIGVYFDGSSPFWSKNIDVDDTVTDDILGLDHGPGSSWENYITFVTNYWDADPYDSGDPDYASANPIAEASGTVPAAPNNLTISYDDDQTHILLTGDSEAWATLTSVVVQQNGFNIASYVTIANNGAIEANIPTSVINSSTITFNVVVSDPDGDTSSTGSSNTLNAYKATSPSPSDEAMNVDVDASLSWTAGYDADTHDVYFGTSLSAVENATHASPEYKGNQSSTTYDPGTLDADTTYYWSIDEVNDINWTGNTWSFTTQSGADSNLIAWYSFDETSGATAADSSGNNNDGNVTTATWDSSGQINGCLDFNDNAGYVTIPTAVINDNIEEELTITMWCYGGSDQPVTGHAFYSSTNANGSGRIHSFRAPFVSGSDEYYFWCAWGDATEDEISLKNNSSAYWSDQWVHYAVTKNTSTGYMRIYRNGTEIKNGSSKTALPDTVAAVCIGSNTAHSDDYEGYIDEVRIYNRELDVAEIEALADVNLIAWYKFDETSGDSAIDSSGYGYDGTVTTATWDSGGQVNGCLDFNDNTGYVTIPPELINDNISDEITIMMWCYGGSDQPVTGHAFYSSTNANGSGRVHSFRTPFVTGGNEYYFWCAWGDGTEDEISHLANGSAYWSDQWVHYAMTKNTSTGYMRIYRNGTEIKNGSSKTALPDTVAAICIGSNTAHSDDYEGYIDEVRIYNKELSQSDVNDIYTEGL